MRLKLYHCPFACSGVTMNALEETGLNYDDQLVNIGKGVQQRPGFQRAQAREDAARSSM